MPFLLLLVLSLACLPIKWPPPPFEMTEQGSSLLTWFAVAAMVGMAALIARRTRRQLACDPSRLESVLRRYSSFRIYHLFSLFGLFGLALYGLGWGWTVRSMCTPAGAEDMLPAAEVLILAPFLTALVLSWVCFYDTERALHAATTPVGVVRPFWGRWAYVGFHARHNLGLVVAPLSLLILLQSLLRQFPNLQSDWRFQVGALGLSIAVFLCIPWIVRVVWGLKPLPAGPLRARLETVSDRLKFRCSDILLWNTHGGVANAMVVGVVPFLRYVLLTDRLVTDLSPEELEAVFGHEVGHVKHHHMIYYVSFLIISLAVLMAIWTALYDITKTSLPALASLLDPNTDLSVLPITTLLGAYIFVVFGFLSRRCERQADIYGCRAVSCSRPDCAGHDGGVAQLPGRHSLCPTGIRTFIQALEKVACLNGISRSKPGWLSSWQHSTIARRVEFLQEMLADPALEPRFQRSVGLVKWVLLLCLGSVLLALVVTYGWSNLLPL